MNPVIDCLEAIYVNSEKLAAAAVRWAQEKGKSPQEVIQLILNEVLGNGLVDSELEENIIVDLAKTFECDLVNVQHELNGADDDFNGDLDDE
jgi:hypothetical protein